MNKKKGKYKKIYKKWKKTCIVLVKEVWKQNDVLFLWDLLKLGFVSFQEDVEGIVLHQGVILYDIPSDTQTPQMHICK